MTKPPVSVKPTIQQSIYLLLAQGALSLSARIGEIKIKVASQSPPQAMLRAMAWMI
jgi:hypothetical protein